MGPKVTSAPDRYATYISLPLTLSLSLSLSLSIYIYIIYNVYIYIHIHIHIHTHIYYLYIYIYIYRDTYTALAFRSQATCTICRPAGLALKSQVRRGIAGSTLFLRPAITYSMSMILNSSSTQHGLPYESLQPNCVFSRACCTWQSAPLVSVRESGGG